MATSVELTELAMDLAKVRTKAEIYEMSSVRYDLSQAYESLLVEVREAVWREVGSGSEPVGEAEE